MVLDLWLNALGRRLFVPLFLICFAVDRVLVLVMAMVFLVLVQKPLDLAQKLESGRVKS